MARREEKTPGKPLPTKGYRTNDTTPATPQRHHLVQVILNAHMGWQHDSMRSVMEDMDIDHAGLEPGQFVVFLNRHRTKAKIYTAHGVIAYMRSETRAEITFEQLSLIPRAFQSHGNIAALEPLRLAIDTGLEVSQQPTTTAPRTDRVIVRRNPTRPEVR